MIDEKWADSGAVKKVAMTYLKRTGRTLYRKQENGIFGIMPQPNTYGLPENHLCVRKNVRKAPDPALP